MKKFLGYIFSPIAILVYFFWLIVFQPIQWVALRLFGYKAHKFCVDILDLLLTRTPLLVFNTTTFVNKHNLPTNRPKIFISNHQSLFDIPPLIWHLRKYHAKFISKIELTKGIPSISFNLKHGGGANIDRKDPRQSLMEMGKLGTRMKENNWSCVIFPEGTRSKDGVVKTFQAGGIAIILKKCPDALIVPIAIKDTWKMIRYGFYPLNTFTPMTFEILEPIEPSTGTVEEVVKEAEDRVKKALRQGA